MDMHGPKSCEISNELRRVSLSGKRDVLQCRKASKHSLLTSGRSQEDIPGWHQRSVGSHYA